MKFKEHITEAKEVCFSKEQVAWLADFILNRLQLPIGYLSMFEDEPNKISTDKIKAMIKELDKIVTAVETIKRTGKVV